MTLFFVTGASGAGKSACMPDLARLLPDMALHDFDEVGVPASADHRWRLDTTEHWLRRGIAYRDGGKDLIVCGGAVYGEILASPSAPQAQPIKVALLDCGDVVRLDRLRARGTHGVSQDMLNWAAWQRGHAVDPGWLPAVIREDGVPMPWESWTRGDPRWQVTVIDTTHLTVAQVAEELAAWVRSARS